MKHRTIGIEIDLGNYTCRVWYKDLGSSGMDYLVTKDQYKKYLANLLWAADKLFKGSERENDSEREREMSATQYDKKSWRFNTVWDIFEQHDPAGIDRGEIIQKAVLLYAALLWEGDIDTAPDWVRIVHNAWKGARLQDVLDVALARLTDGE